VLAELTRGLARAARLAVALAAAAALAGCSHAYLLTQHRSWSDAKLCAWEMQDQVWGMGFEDRTQRARQQVMAERGLSCTSRTTPAGT